MNLKALRITTESKGRIYSVMLKEGRKRVMKKQNNYHGKLSQINPNISVITITVIVRLLFIVLFVFFRHIVI